MASRLSAATSPLAFCVQLYPFGTETDSGFSINNTGSQSPGGLVSRDGKSMEEFT